MRWPALVLMPMLLLLGGCEGTRRAPPPVIEPPVIAPPVIEPPVIAPLVIEPPVIEPPVVTSTKDPVRPDTSSDRLLRYFAYVRKLQGAELVKEHEAARQLYASEHTDFTRVRYAVLLSVPGVAFSDDARALDTLEPVLKNQNSVLHGAAFLLSALIQEQRRSQGLQQKLDALRALEKTLIEREGKRK